MADEKQKPCENPDCDACHPAPRWKVATTTVRRIVHERALKAATAEEVLREYEEGTAWPSSYDERTVEVLEQGTPVVTQITDAHVLEFHRTHNCYHRLKGLT